MQLPRAVRYGHHPFLLKYMTRPMHFFGVLGPRRTTLGGILLTWLGFDNIFMSVDIIEYGPLMVGGAMLLLGGLMMFSTGLIRELVMHRYYEL